MRTILTNQKLLNHNCSRNMGANLFGSYRCLQAFSFHFEDIKGLWLPLSPHQKKFGLPWWCLSSPERISWKPFDLYSPQSSGLQSLDQMKTGRGGQLGNGTDTCWEWIDVKIEFDKKSQSSESGGGKNHDDHIRRISPQECDGSINLKTLSRFHALGKAALFEMSEPNSCLNTLFHLGKLFPAKSTVIKLVMGQCGWWVWAKKNNTQSFCLLLY